MYTCVLVALVRLSLIFIKGILTPWQHCTELVLCPGDCVTLTICADVAHGPLAAVSHSWFHGRCTHIDNIWQQWVIIVTWIKDDSSLLQMLSLRCWWHFGSGTDHLVVLVAGTVFLKSLRLRRFKSDWDKIWQCCTVDCTKYHMACSRPFEISNVEFLYILNHLWEFEPSSSYRFTELFWQQVENCKMLILY